MNNNIINIIEPSLPLQIKSCDVHIWHVHVDKLKIHLEFLKKLLSVEESNRVDKFMFEKDKTQYITARGILRLLLSRYLDNSAADLCFRFNEFGKPYIDPINSDKLCFNVSHSEKLILIAFTLNREIGIDVEFLLRPITDINGIVQRYFTDSEKILFDIIPQQRKNSSFFKLWTRKEAYIKALGKGLYEPLNKFTVISDFDDQESFISPGSGDKKGWLIRSINCGSDYIGAVAVEQDDLEFYQYTTVL